MISVVEMEDSEIRTLVCAGFDGTPEGNVHSGLER